MARCQYNLILQLSAQFGSHRKNGGTQELTGLGKSFTESWCNRVYSPSIPAHGSRDKCFIILCQALRCGRSEVNDEVNFLDSLAQFHEWIKFQVAKTERIEKNQRRIIPHEINHLIDLRPKIASGGDSLDCVVPVTLFAQPAVQFLLFLSEESRHPVGSVGLGNLQRVLKHDARRTGLARLIAPRSREPIDNPDALNALRRADLRGPRRKVPLKGPQLDLAVLLNPAEEISAMLGGHSSSMGP